MSNRNKPTVAQKAQTETIITSDLDMQILTEKLNSLETKYETEIQSLKKAIETRDNENEDLRNQIQDLISRLDIAEGRSERLEKDMDTAKDKIQDLTWRSMRDNLLFFNIEEKINEKSDDTRTILEQFLKTKLKIEEPIGIDRVHRVGPVGRKSPASIVAKFNPYSGLEKVLASSHLLKDTKYWVMQQLPKEQVEQRKAVRELKKETAESDSRARLSVKKDKLFVNDIQTCPPVKPITDENDVDVALKLKITHGPTVEKGDRFQAHLVNITDASSVKPALLNLYQDQFIAKASYNAYVYTFKNHNHKCMDFDDDGETGITRQLRQCLNNYKLDNVMLVLTGWKMGRISQAEKTKLIEKCIKDTLKKAKKLSK